MIAILWWPFLLCMCCFVMVTFCVTITNVELHCHDLALSLSFSVCMFVTMVVQLPSDYDGGVLCVCHNGEMMFNFSWLKGMIVFHCAPFYADCQHKLCKVAKSVSCTILCILVMWCPSVLPSCVSRNDLRLGTRWQSWSTSNGIHAYSYWQCWYLWIIN